MRVGVRAIRPGHDWPERPEGRLVDTDVQRKAAGDRAAEFGKDGMVIRDGVIPLRVRGPARERRLDALISVSSVAYRSTPEDLAGPPMRTLARSEGTRARRAGP